MQQSLHWNCGIHKSWWGNVQIDSILLEGLFLCRGLIAQLVYRVPNKINLVPPMAYAELGSFTKKQHQDFTSTVYFVLNNLFETSTQYSTTCSQVNH